jgi:CheY-like chemotaxis protein
MMKGRIWVDSEPGEGSTFHFTAEFGVRPEVVAPLLEASPWAWRGVAGSGEPGPHVLLVEDNPINRKLAERVLEKAGYRVTSTDNGAAALSALERDGFDLVLMDVEMPGMDGVDTTARIREREKATGEHVPVFALTAHAMPAQRVRCLAAGMDGFLAKPIQAATLLDAISRAQSEALRQGASGRTVVLDRAALLDRVGGDANLLTELIG